MLDKKKKLLLIRMHSFIDSVINAAALTAAFLINNLVHKKLPGTTLDIHSALFFALASLIILFFSFRFFEVYSAFTEKKFKTIFLETFKAAAIGTIIIAAGTWFAGYIEGENWLLPGLFFVLDILFLMVSKAFIYTSWRRYGKKELNIHNILIIGGKERAKEIISLLKSTHIDFNIVGCLELGRPKIGKEVQDGVKIIGSVKDLQKIVLKHVVDEVIFAMPLRKIESADEYMFLIEKIGIRIRILPEWQIHSLLYKPEIAAMAFDDFYGLPTMILTTTTSKHRDLLLKLMFDYIVTGAAMVPLLPVFLGIALFIKIFSSGPVFFKQERLGKNGRRFGLYKFRTMVPDAEKLLEKLKEQNEADGPAFKIKNDPRIIPYIGAFLRKTSLDELPQLMNVLKGEMSLVGPRPPIPGEVDEYDIWQRRRLSMRPGLTCIWQIAPSRNELSFDQWMELDLDYIDNWSLWLDFKLLWKTGLAVLGAQGR
ncbi:MAG: sugar transferase [bacterium]|nr:sugar transferase [bacterium]